MTKVLIAITGWVGSAENGEHQAVRDTWLKHGLPEGWDYKFFIGDGTPIAEDDSLVWQTFERDSQPGYGIKARESARRQKPFTYIPKDDEVVLHVPDDFAHLAYKIRAQCKWALANGYEHLFQIAPDIYVALDRLAASGFDRYDYVGKSVGGWYAGGGGHWLSREAFSKVVDEPITHWAADAWVGKIMREHGISLHCDLRYAVDYPEIPRSDNDIICSHLGVHAGLFGKYEPLVMCEVHSQYAPNAGQSGRDVVIGYAKGYDWPQLEPYVISLCSCGFDGDKVLLVNSINAETADHLTSKGFSLVPCENTGIHPNVERLMHVSSYLRGNPNYRYAIWTDVRDVVFQADPVAWIAANLGKCRIVAVSEGLIYRNEKWGADNMRMCFGAEWMRDEVIYNCGTIAGFASTLRDLFLNIYLMSRGALGQPADQAALNILLHQSPYREITLVPKQEEGWATMLGTMVCRPNDFAKYLLEPVPIFDEENALVLAPKYRKPFCVVHQYDRVVYKPAIEKRYREKENKRMPSKQQSVNSVEEKIFNADYSNRTLFISTPMYGGQCSGIFHQSILGLQRICLQVGLRAAISDVWQEALITRARNDEADKYRASGMTDHLFVDADQGFHPNDILQMVLADKDIVTAPVAKKAINWKRVAEAVKKGWPPESLELIAPDININTLEPVRFEGEIAQRISHGGTGIMLIKRHVYDKMQEAFPEIEYVPMEDEACEYGDGKHKYAFFDTGIDPETKHYMSEDYNFCRRWTQIGGEVHILPWLVTAHAGPFVYIGNAHAIASFQSGEKPVLLDAQGNPVTAAA